MQKSFPPKETATGPKTATSRERQPTTHSDQNPTRGANLQPVERSQLSGGVDNRTTGIPIRYVKDCPGELVHVDIKKLGRVPDGGGWRAIGIENRGTRQKVGYEFCHSMVNNHSRVAYTEILDSENTQACAGFMLRAAQWFAGLGYRIDRVMTDNALAYTRGRAFTTTLDTIGATHKRIRPFPPQTNGKVERFHQTLLAGWTDKHAYQNNDKRRQTLTEFIDTYNQTRPHSELGRQSPITVLVNHLCGKDT